MVQISLITIRARGFKSPYVLNSAHNFLHERDRAQVSIDLMILIREDFMSPGPVQKCVSISVCAEQSTEVVNNVRFENRVFQTTLRFYIFVYRVFGF